LQISKIQDGGQPLYPSLMLPDFDKIWYADANFNPEDSHVTKT